MRTTALSVLRGIVLVSLLTAIAIATNAASLSAVAKGEIAYLLSYVEQSGCRFGRNGTWHDSRAAREHLEKKERYLEDHGEIASAEDFIEKAATRSSVTGQKYVVQCGSSQVVPSADWLRAELGRYRAVVRSAPTHD